MYKCINSEQYYTYNDKSFLQYRGEACSNDPHFYQSCDKRTGGQITNGEILCEHYICNESGASLLTSAELSAMGRGRCTYDCENTDLNKERCGDESDEKRVILPSGEKARPSEVCNENCDVTTCEDEAFCNGYNYGIFCDYWWGGISYVPPGSICRGVSECYSGEDEDCTIEAKTANTCRHFKTGKTVPVHNYTRCTPIKRSDYLSNYNNQLYCKIEDVSSYQTNCSDPSRVALNCKINDYLSTVSKYLICFDDSIAVCDDRIESDCLKTKTCTIHKHLMCDENTDCKDEADETHEICLSKTTETCRRRVGSKIEQPIPISWLKGPPPQGWPSEGFVQLILQ